jgi:hypothetical protein
MIRILTLAALLLTASCSQQQQPAPPANDVAAAPAAPAAPRAKAEIPSLKGSWTITGAGGVTATFAGGRVVLSEGCVRRAWTYTQNRNSVAFTSAPGGSSNCGGSSSSALDRVYGPLSDANLAVFSADGREVTLSGLGGTLQLARR